jgi:hypothetical protein
VQTGQTAGVCFPDIALSGSMFETRRAHLHPTAVGPTIFFKGVNKNAE